MANDTCLQMVSAKEIAALKKDPSSIGPFDKPQTQHYSTYFPCTINYLLVGAPYPDPKTTRPLGAALFGLDFVACENLEAGQFGIVPPGKVTAIASRLEKVDLKKIKAAVASADPAKLAKQNVDDFELLISDDDAVKELVDDIRGLAKFYRRAANKKLGIAMFTA